MNRRVDGLERCVLPQYVVETESCSAEVRVFRMGTESRAAVRYRMLDGACTVSDEGTDSLTDLFSVAPLSLEDFQSGAFQAGEETGGVTRVDVFSADGARIPSGFRDATEEFACHLEDQGGQHHCVPSEPGFFAGTFKDTGCLEPAAVAWSCAEMGDELPFVRTSTDGSAVYYRGGEKLETIYAGRPGSCAPSSPDFISFALGEQLPLSRFASGEVEEIVDGTLTTFRANVGSTSMPLGTLVSTALGGFACFAAYASDGELRCLPPPDRFSDDFFADAACTQPVEYSQEEFIALATADVCPTQIRVYERGERHEGPVYMVKDGVCELSFERPPNDSARTPYFVFPQEIPASEFTRLSESMR